MTNEKTTPSHYPFIITYKENTVLVPLYSFGRYVTGRPEVDREIEGLFEDLFHATNGQTIRTTAEEPAHETFDVLFTDFANVKDAARLAELVLRSTDENVSKYYWAVDSGDVEMTTAEFQSLINGANDEDAFRLAKLISWKDLH